MAITVTLSKQGPQQLGAGYVVVEAGLTPDSSYPTGGYAITIGQLGKTNMRVIAGVSIIGGKAAAGGYEPVWDYENGKLKIWRTGAINAVREDVPNTTNLSALTWRVLFYLRR